MVAWNSHANNSINLVVMCIHARFIAYNLK